MIIDKLYIMTKKGDIGSEKALFSLLHDSLNTFVQRRVEDKAEAENLVQDALTVISEKYRNIVFEKSFTAWAYGVLKNVIKNHLRKEATRRTKLAAITEQTDSQAAHIADFALRDQLMFCLNRLAKRNRQFTRAVVLSYYGYSADEISKRLGITKPNLYNVLSRARAMLRECLKEKGY